MFGVDNQNEEEQKTSKYNAGVAIQMRLDGLWKLVNVNCVAGNFKNWNSYLDRVWSELARDIKEIEYNDFKTKEGKEVIGYKTKFDKFDEELGKLGKFNDNAADSFKPVTSDETDKRNKQYKLLMEKELFLKRLENHLGKGTAFEHEDEDDF